MLKTIKNGVYPTMITPYTKDNKIDYIGVKAIIDFYVRENVAGIFSVCQSSEMFYLSLEERVELAAFVVKNSPNGLDIVVSGHTSNDLETQIEEAKQICAVGVGAYVVLPNRFASESESDDVLIERMSKFICAVNDIALGVYECPYPYKRVLTPKVLQWCVDSGQFLFSKDTSCDINKIKEKLDIVRGSNLKIFNANSATLLESLTLGCSGFSGVMANFHPSIYAWLCENYKKYPEKAKLVQALVGATSTMECQCYPINAKYHMNLVGVNINTFSRSRDEKEFTDNRKNEVENLYLMCKTYMDSLLK